MIKPLFRLSLHMVTGFVQSPIKLCGLDWAAPDYSTICRRQKLINIAISYQKNRDGLHSHSATTRAVFIVAANTTITAVTSGNWLSGSSRQIINYGNIYGAGGNGGYYDADTVMVGDGGTAITAVNNSSFIDVRNYGLIAGGGGGGAAGKSEYSIGEEDYYAVGAGGGGAPFGQGGSNINITTPEGKTLVNLIGATAALATPGNGASGTGLQAGSGGQVGENGQIRDSTLENGAVGQAGLIASNYVTITNIGSGQTKGRTS